MRPLMPRASIGMNDAAIPPPFGITTARGRMTAIPTKITVRKEDNRILRNRLRIQIPRAANTFDAIGAILQAPDLLAQIADMRVDAAVVGPELTPEHSSHQVLACDHRAGALQQHLEQIEFDRRQFDRRAV